ncbi:MAG: MFS transporter, partial [Bacteroidales bacterium]|nr:MFS transporter [Bacteroidales bacterium]
MNIKLRLIVMNFLEFAVWGAYLTSMGGFLYGAGLADKIWLFFAIQGIVSIFMPALMGIVADKWIQAQKVLSICHGIAGLFMMGAGVYAMTNVGNVQFVPFFVLYAISVAFFMPTIAIANSVAYTGLDVAGLDSVKHFPPIRVFGTIGFICCMLAVNFITNGSGVQFQHSHEQFLLSGALSLVLCCYALTLPACPCLGKGKPSKSFAEASGLSAFKLFKEPKFAVFFLFSMFLGASLQITNGYANTFITHFREVP